MYVRSTAQPTTELQNPQAQIAAELEGLVGSAVVVHIARDKHRHDPGKVFAAFVVSLHEHGVLLQRGRYREFLAYADIHAGHARIEAALTCGVAS